MAGLTVIAEAARKGEHPSTSSSTTTFAVNSRDADDHADSDAEHMLLRCADADVDADTNVGCVVVMLLWRARAAKKPG